MPGKSELSMPSFHVGAAREVAMAGEPSSCRPLLLGAAALGEAQLVGTTTAWQGRAPRANAAGSRWETQWSSL
jgi:hypothetical protein